MTQDPRSDSDYDDPGFPLLAAMLPIVLGIVMAFFLNSPLYLLFGLLSPTLLAGNWWAERQRRLRRLRRGVPEGDVVSTSEGLSDIVDADLGIPELEAAAMQAIGDQPPHDRVSILAMRVGLHGLGIWSDEDLEDFDRVIRVRNAVVRGDSKGVSTKEFREARQSIDRLRALVVHATPDKQ